jgi:superfamily I DNA/RNA helicase
VLTIHTAKGLEANNVVVIGAKFFNVEERCVSYVAATRARNLLIWTKAPARAKKTTMMSSWER